jgi:hypothetical protein
MKFIAGASALRLLHGSLHVQPFFIFSTCNTKIQPNSLQYVTEETSMEEQNSCDET